MANPNVQVLYNQVFINNSFVDSVSGKQFPTINPANKKKITNVAKGDKADIDLAVNAAKTAFQPDSEWRTMDSSARSQMIYKLAELINKHKIHLANLESLDSGKPFCDSISNVSLTVSVLQYFAGCANKIHGKTIPADRSYVAFTKFQPVGVIGQIIPWNFPILMLAWKWGPALATGCTIVLKPSEQTPLTALHVAALSKEAGFPDGVINVVPGYGPTAGQAISSHPDINKVAFTGSIEVGKLIMAEAAKSNLKRVSLELSDKSSLVIFNDFDVDEAVQIAYDALFVHMGQSFCASTRTFVQEGIYEEFVKKAAKLVSEKKVGDPFDPDTTIWSLVSEKQYNKTLDLFESGKQEGAKVEAGGSKVGDIGYFIHPTVFSGVTDNMRIAKEELFGPVQQIFKFKSLDEVIKRANNTYFGMAAGVLTKDLSIASKYMENVNAGLIWINCYNPITPQTSFEGLKQSGLRKEVGKYSLENYLEIKTITIKK